MFFLHAIVSCLWPSLAQSIVMAGSWKGCSTGNIETIGLNSYKQRCWPGLLAWDRTDTCKTAWIS